MKAFKHILYALVWVLYPVVSFHWFPIYNVNIVFPSVLLFAIGGWLYGTYTGLLFVLIAMPYHFILLERYGDILEIYQAKAFGVGIMTLVAVISGTTKRMMDKVKDFSAQLDQKVIERTHELDTLTTQLISEDENLRINLAQSIHDGLGQHLTGLLLYCSSLEATLRNKNPRHADCAAVLEENAQRNLQLARKVSRTLFPVRMPEIGLEAALDELTSYFTETTSLKFSIQLDNCHQHLTNQTALHLYRITYEGILSALHYGAPSQIRIDLAGKNGICLLRIESDETNLMNENVEMELMRYRAKQIKGQLTIGSSSGNRTIIECQVSYDR